MMSRIIKEMYTYTSENDTFKNVIRIDKWHAYLKLSLIFKFI